ncbi:hypothetical protein MMC13_007560, partial [Lambiella insularis]|nr:hypothetical protein [Lambiella insularis]
MDPLSESFLAFWDARTKQNASAVGRMFNLVTHSDVRSRQDYDRIYECFFHEADEEAVRKAPKRGPAKYRWGHVVADNFASGERGLKEMKDLLCT